jgi:hypothetical protein
MLDRVVVMSLDFLVKKVELHYKCEVELFEKD